MNAETGSVREIATNPEGDCVYLTAVLSPRGSDYYDGALTVEERIAIDDADIDRLLDGVTTHVNGPTDGGPTGQAQDDDGGDR